MDQQKVTVEIFGHKLNLKSSADSGYASHLAAFVDEQIRKVSRQSNDPIKVVLLASMNIANELFDARKKEQESAEAAARKADSLIEMLEKAF